MTYELTIILRISDSVETVKDRVNQILQKHEVSVLSEDSWDIKKLAYSIDNESEGYYLFMCIESKPSAIDRVKANFKLENDILRYLFIRFKEKKSA
ncbi:MAG: 30S ribosomal protein S6 [Spirochaetota bacterium]|nr:30S ribosomal protein S6 [Spirochaetota bacterium]